MKLQIAKNTGKLEYIPIGQLLSGNNYKSPYILASHSTKTTKTGKKYLDVVLRDSNDSLPCKWWDVPENYLGDIFEDSSFVLAEFTVEEYNDKLQGKIISMRPVTDDDNFDRNILIPHSLRSPEDMYNELYNEANGFKNDDLKRIVCTILENNKEFLMTIPAAKSMHHDYIGGLLEHSCEVLETAKKLSEIYPCHNELLYAAAIIHDIAKIKEFDQGPLGLVGDYTSRGKLIGHVTLGMSYIESICQQLNINGEIKYLLQHMILSHHGKPEYGSPVHPMFIEAMLLHECDVLSAKSREFYDATADLEPGTWSEKVFGLENVQVYKFKEETEEQLS